ncbi:MAG: DUF2569 family protein, partial [Candidatus Omnitrophota bacterium]
GGIAALLIALTIFTAENVTDSVVALISFFNGLVLLVLFYKIIKITVKKDTATPNKLVKYITWILLVTLIFAFLEGLSYYISSGVKGLSNLGETAAGIIRTLIWYAIWSSYFKKSKRVAAYYGNNAK